MDTFVELKDYPGYFIAHSPPRLKRVINNIEYVCTQTPSSKRDNYWSVTLKTPEGKYVKRNMHRLLMQTFVPNPQNKAHVNHIDGDKSNNDLANLEWATEKENAQHAVRTGLTNPLNCTKAVYQYRMNGTFVAAHISDVAAEEATGVRKQNISKVTLGLRVHAGYFQWRREYCSQIDAVLPLYIKGYNYKNSFFPTLAALASHLGYTGKLANCSLRRFNKAIRQDIEVVYYD